MSQYIKSYHEMTDLQRKQLIQEMYSDKKLSFADIASSYSTYANKIRRDAKKFNIKIRDKSEAQSNALKTGKHSHPTKGKPRTEQSKIKIGNTFSSFWKA